MMETAGRAVAEAATNAAAKNPSATLHTERTVDGLARELTALVAELRPAL